MKIDQRKFEDYLQGKKRNLMQAFFYYRSFLVFTLDQHRQFSKLVEIIDKTLNEHRYPSYYEVNY